MDNLVIKNTEKLIKLIRKDPDAIDEETIATNLRENLINGNSWSLWKTICSKKKLSEKFMSEFAEIIEWSLVIRYTKLSENQLNKYAKFMKPYDWIALSRTHKLTIEFINKHLDKLYLLAMLKNKQLQDLFEPIIPNRKQYKQLIKEINNSVVNSYHYLTQKPYFDLYIHTLVKIGDPTSVWVELGNSSLITCKETLCYYIKKSFSNDLITMPKFYTIVVNRKLKKINSKRRSAIHNKMNILLRRVSRSVALPKPELVTLERDCGVAEMVLLCEDSPWLRSKATISLLALTLQRGMIGGISGKRAYTLKAFDASIRVSGWYTVTRVYNKEPVCRFPDVRKLIKNEIDLSLVKNGIYHNGIVTAVKAAKRRNIL